MTGKKFKRPQVDHKDQVTYDNLVEALRCLPELEKRTAKLETLIGQMAVTLIEIFGRLILLEQEGRGTAEQGSTVANPSCDPPDHP